MSHSFRTAPVKVQATRRAGLSLPLKLVERQPRPGDVHILSRKHLATVLPFLPAEFLEGLRRVELRPRANSAIGAPFAFYRPSERAVILYSLPPGEWQFPFSGPAFGALFDDYGAEVIASAASTTVRWKDRGDAARFFFCWVFMHELGHHFDFRYVHKRKLPSTMRMREESADMHMRRQIATNVWATLQTQGLLAQHNDA